jgi:hypothetical protein
MAQDQLTFWSEERHVSRSASQDSAKDWLTTVGTWRWSMREFLSAFGQSFSSGKTCPVFLVQTADGTLLPSSGRFKNSGMGGPTESWTLNTSEFPSVVVESSLSDVLETGEVQQRYFLSRKACEGILRRAGKRGKKLPWALETALKQAASAILLVLCAATLIQALIPVRMPTQAALFLMLGGGGALPRLSRCLNAGGMGRQDYETETLIPTGGFFDDAIAFSCKDSEVSAGRISPTLRAMSASAGRANGGGQVAVAEKIGVRRLTPKECERLQGFPDSHTLVEYRGKPAADGPRYKAIGNSMAVPVMRWIGKRIKEVNDRMRYT